MEARSQQRKPRWTYAEFARLPESGSTRHEVIADELVVTPAPGRVHQRIATVLSSRLHMFAESHALGEVYAGPFDVLFAEGDYLEPDLLFVRKERLRILSDRGVEAAPDLVVEILSPATAQRDRGIKLERYRLYGVPEYWVVDPGARRVEVWDLAGGARAPTVIAPGEMLRWRPVEDGPVLAIDVAELFGPTRG